MADETFGYCEDCQYWDPGVEGELKPCSRINRDQVDVELPDSELQADQQRFLTRARFGCSLFDPVEGMEGQPVEETEETVQPSGKTSSKRSTSPQSLDQFLE